MNHLYTTVIPNPDFGDNVRKQICGETASELARNVRNFIDDSGYGASDIGARFNIYFNADKIGKIGYNGSIHFDEPLALEDCDPYRDAPYFIAINDYEKRVRELEAEGCTRSDAQAVADAEGLS